MRYLILFFMLSGCSTLKERYERRADQIKEYCDQVFQAAGYNEKKKPHKLSMARCIYQTENRVELNDNIGGPLWGIYVGILLLAFGVFW